MKLTKCLPRDGIGMVEAAAAAAGTTVADMTVVPPLLAAGVTACTPVADMIVTDTTVVPPLVGTGACRAGAIDRIQRSGNDCACTSGRASSALPAQRGI